MSQRPGGYADTIIDLGQLMQNTHVLTIDSDNGEDVVMVCPEDTCRRRVVVGRSGRFVVIDQGDFFARHVGGSGGLRVTASVGT